MGSVVLAKSRRTPQQQVAVKIVKLWIHCDGDSVPRLEQQDWLQLQSEVAITRDLGHPNVMRTLAAYCTKEEVQIVMPVAMGGEVAQVFAQRGAYSEEDSRVIVAQLLAALAYLHGLGILHGDVKLQNVVYKDESQTTVVLVDFGFAQHLSGPADGSGARHLNVMLGTMPFMAPELFETLEGARLNPGESCLVGYDEKVDIWAAGVFTHLLLLGSLPFDANFLLEFKEKILAGFKGFTQESSDLTANAQAFITVCLAQDAGAGRPSAAELMKHCWLTQQACKLLRRKSAIGLGNVLQEQAKSREETLERRRASLDMTVSRTTIFGSSRGEQGDNQPLRLTRRRNTVRSMA